MKIKKYMVNVEYQDTFEIWSFGIIVNNINEIIVFIKSKNVLTLKIDLKKVTDLFIILEELFIALIPIFIPLVLLLTTVSKPDIEVIIPLLIPIDTSFISEIIALVAPFKGGIILLFINLVVSSQISILISSI